MIQYINDQQIKEIINNNDKLIMVFGKGIDCSVCHAVENRVNTNLTSKFPNLDIYYLTIEENPEFRGQHLIFSVPTLLLFDGDKEIHRESRIIDFQKLERVLGIYFD